jgi:hypothetical protein
VPWRFPKIPALSRATAIVAVALVALGGAGGLLYIAGGGLVPTPSPGPSATPRPQSTTDIGAWNSYTSEVYGYMAAYPGAWTVDHFATRAWSAAIDGIDPSSPAMDTFTNTSGTVAVSAWRAPHGPLENPGDPNRMLAWVEDFCVGVGDRPCDGIAARAIPMCLEPPACNTAFAVPFQDDVMAFFVGTPDNTVNVVAVWRGETDPTLAPYGGAIALLNEFLERRDEFAISFPDASASPGSAPASR